MSVEMLVEGVHQIPLGIVNAFLLDRGEPCLIDTGVPGKEPDVLKALRGLGYRPEDLRHILVTHLHADHTGGLRRLKRATGARAYMHKLDAEAVRQGISTRPTRAAPGMIPWLITNLFMRLGQRPSIEPTEVENELQDGQVLSFAGDLEVVHALGHAAGQVAFLLPGDGVLFAADAASNILGLGYPPIFEDLGTGLESLRRLAGLDFEIACFGHGGPIVGGAAGKFQKKWG